MQVLSWEPSVNCSLLADLRCESGCECSGEPAPLTDQLSPIVASHFPCPRAFVKDIKKRCLDLDQWRMNDRSYFPFQETLLDVEALKPKLGHNNLLLICQLSGLFLCVRASHRDCLCPTEV